MFVKRSKEASGIGRLIPIKDFRLLKRQLFMGFRLSIWFGLSL